MSNWVQHALNRASFQPRRQAALLVVLGVVMTLIFGGISLSQIANYASTNRAIEALIAQRNRLELENENLRAEIASFQTVPRLLERARNLGYREASVTDIEYIMIDGYDPDRIMDVVAITQSEPFDDTPTYDATFAGWLQAQWDSLVNQFRAFGR
ncbi:MAG: FtsB family cell division protein [Anaerolineae bacterium]